MRLVPHDLEVSEIEPVDVVVQLTLPHRELRERPRLSPQLLPQRVDMVQVHVRISNCVYEVPWLPSSDLGDHVGEEGIGRDVEGDAESHVRGALVHLAGELILLCVDVKLAKHVTGRQGHLVQIARVPRAHHNPPILGIVLDLLDAVRQLVHPLARIIRMHVRVLRPEVPPLKPVHRAQVALLPVLQPPRVEELAGAVPVPDVNVLLR
mmetsp:Transcript_48018/g.102108  ORF Transcript_48018/g.102108 Transcript_48018/m.102108 type:complete len:208 (-) Transcript_48018:1159-1782(-)